MSGKVHDIITNAEMVYISECIFTEYLIFMSFSISHSSVQYEILPPEFHLSLSLSLSLSNEEYSWQ
jgi:hypothetical protein